MAIKTYKKGDSTKIATNFKAREFDCHGKGCCAETKIDEKLVSILQNIRDHFGKPVIVTAYRCPTYNAQVVNAASKSYHTYGQAADIHIDGVAPAEIAKYAESIGVLGIGLYETSKDGHFVHVDTRTSKSFWYGHAQEKRTTFGGAPVYVPSVKEWQLAAIADGYKFPEHGADGAWGSECASVAQKAIVKKRITYSNKHLTRIVQKVVGVEADGKCGNDTTKAIKAYQEKHGLYADGKVGLNTWKKMLGIK